MSKKRKPIVVRNGLAVVKIYDTGHCVTLCWRDKRVRYRKVFAKSKLEEAKQEATRIVAMLAGSTAHLAQVSADHLRYLTHCETLAKQAGIPLLQAVESGIAVHKANAALTPAKPSDLAEQMLKEKEQDGASQVYLKPLKFILRSFSDAFDSPIHEIDSTAIEGWLRSREDIGPRRRKNILKAVRLLFTFARTKGALFPEKMTAAERVPLPKVTATHAVEIFTVEEMTTLLRNAPDPLRPVLIFGAFCGIRTHGEMERLHWENVLDDKVVVAEQKLRGAGRRYTPLPLNAKIWLGRCKYRQGRIWPRGQIAEHMARLSEETKIEWKHNGLRHSFISYRVADIQNVPQVALEAGNSVQMIHRHYRELVTQEQAKQWFNILPKDLTKEELAMLNPPAPAKKKQTAEKK